MVSQIKRGVQDFIGAARPSIADPFLPAKIRDGREDEIRECHRLQHLPGSEQRRGGPALHAKPDDGRGMAARLHPERISTYPKRERALVVGGGPAGLEAALTLGRRGLEVTLAEAGDAFAGGCYAKRLCRGFRPGCGSGIGGCT